MKLDEPNELKAKFFNFKRLNVRSLLIIPILVIVFVYFSLDKSFLKNGSGLVKLVSSNPDPTEELFIVFCTKSHEALLEVLVNSVHKFSTRHILAYGIDFDITLANKTYPRLLTRRIKHSDCGLNIYSCKPYTIMITNTTNGVYFDVDNVAGHYVDKLFEILKAWDGPHPLSPIHESDPRNQYGFMDNFQIKTKSMPYVHGHVLWKSAHKEFIKEWWQLAQHINGANYDETALNMVLWKHNYKHTACKYDPYFSFSEYYFSEKDHNDGVPIINIIFHGAKHPDQSMAVLKKLEESKPKRLQTKCCPPYATEYLKHFMICKYNDSSTFK